MTEIPLFKLTTFEEVPGALWNRPRFDSNRDDMGALVIFLPMRLMVDDLLRVITMEHERSYFKDRVIAIGGYGFDIGGNKAVIFYTRAHSLSEDGEDYSPYLSDVLDKDGVDEYLRPEPGMKPNKPNFESYRGGHWSFRNVPLEMQLQALAAFWNVEPVEAHKRVQRASAEMSE